MYKNPKTLYKNLKKVYKNPKGCIKNQKRCMKKAGIQNGNFKKIELMKGLSPG